MQANMLTPWSGVGIDVEKNESLDSIMHRAKLDFTVDKVPMEIEGQVVPGVYGVVRGEDKKFFSVGGENYVITQPRAALKFFEDFIGSRGRITAAGKFHEGQFIWMLAKGEMDFSMPDGDRIGGYLLFTMPYQVGIGMSVQLLAIRESTGATVPLAMSDKRKSLKLVRHAKVEATQSDSELTFDLAQEELGKFQEMALAAANIRIEEAELDEFFHKSFNLEVADEAWKEHKLIRMSHHAMTSAPGQRMPSCDGTLWGALMAVAYVIDLQSGNSPDTRLYNAWYAWTAAIKARALELVRKQVSAAATGSGAENEMSNRRTKKAGTSKARRQAVA